MFPRPLFIFVVSVASKISTKLGTFFPYFWLVTLFDFLFWQSSTLGPKTSFLLFCSETIHHFWIKFAGDWMVRCERYAEWWKRWRWNYSEWFNLHCLQTWPNDWNEKGAECTKNATFLDDVFYNKWWFQIFSVFTCKLSTSFCHPFTK